ncbi:activin receptor type-2B-like isoform X1 [Montipora capricornis]|uniref:activin receptor type-2B-like isoform X1 n=1 Tax=Montipora foliosa TaxID=591990 RepID=UPI0035F10911
MMDRKFMLTLTVLLAFYLLVDCRRCYHYDYKNCSSHQASCMNLKVCNRTSDYCYSMYNGTTQLLLKGCWAGDLDARCSKTPNCRLEPIRQPFTFCCCYGDYCNLPPRTFKRFTGVH